MATAIHQGGITRTNASGGTVTHWAPQAQQFPHPSGVLYQLPSQMMDAMAQQYGAYAGGMGQIGSAVGGMGGQHSQALAGMGGQHSNALAGLGNAFAQNYGAYGNTLGNIANANAMDSAAYYQSLGGAAAANQSGLSNMWTQALSSLGGLGNTLAASMGMGQQGYQQALAGMQGANQSAVSQYGQSRLNNIGRLGAAEAVGNMSFDFGGGGGSNNFSASGPGGQIASGSYGGASLPGGGGSGGRVSMSPYLDATMDGGVLSQLAEADMEARDRLDRQQDLYRRDYSDMFGQGMLGMLTMGREGANSLRTGMQDFYGNVSRNRPNFGQYLNAATGGFNRSSGDIRQTGQRMSNDFRDMREQMGANFGTSLSALQGLATQVGSGMAEANRTGREAMMEVFDRFFPKPSSSPARTGGSVMLPTIRRGQLPAASRNLPAGSFYGGARIV